MVSFCITKPHIILKYSILIGTTSAGEVLVRLPVRPLRRGLAAAEGALRRQGGEAEALDRARDGSDGRGEGRARSGRVGQDSGGAREPGMTDGLFYFRIFILTFGFLVAAKQTILVELALRPLRPPNSRYTIFDKNHPLPLTKIHRPAGSRL